MNSESPLSGPLPAPDRVVRTRCHPEAGGRTPQDGERQWTVSLPLDDGTILHVRMGADGWRRFRAMIEQMDADDAAERLLG